MSGLVKSISDRTPDTDTAQVAVTMAFALGFGVFAVFVSLWNNGTMWHGLLWAGAWSSVGWFLGFLFGIPRYLSTDTARTPAALNLESMRNELALAVAAAQVSREAVTEAVKAKAAANEGAAEATKAAVQTAKESAEAQARLAADPQNVTLQADAKAKAEGAELARVASDNAAGLVKDADAKVAPAEEAASQAEAAAAAARSKLANQSTSAAASPSSSSLTVNTNLEQISDWLTKIIVGVSLVESQTLLNKMQWAAAYMAKSMVKANDAAVRAVATLDLTSASSVASAPASAASSATAIAANSLDSVGSTDSFAYALMLYFLATGLLGSYLLTRLFLQRALARVANTGQGT